jgi:uncharacterized membrane protein
MVVLVVLAVAVMAALVSVNLQNVRETRPGGSVSADVVVVSGVGGWVPVSVQRSHDDAA